MGRVPLLRAEDAPLLARPFYVDGDPGPIVAVLAHVPELLVVALPFFGRVLGESAVDARTKEIVILRASAVAQCRYCVDAHTLVALDAGLTAEEVRVLRDDAPLAGAFAERERALVAWVDAVAGERGPVAESTAVALRSWFADHEVVELTLLAATTLLLNRLCTALELPSVDATLERLRDCGFGS
ncbi:MAG: carboxymuconolactone decarboxylase family protein [Actinomycetota bacterium]|nr:carboxymuconolactone decarboxylase family protein [Actinomycetota bacterium]